MTASKMNAIVATAYGKADVLEFRQVDKPQAKENEVLIKVHAASATTADSMMLTGRPYLSRLFMGFRKPKHEIPGTGFSGEVVAIGNDVTRFAPGDLVFGETTLGFSTNAEYTVVPEEGIILKKPESLSHAEAATVCDGALTSMNFLQEVSKVEAGHKVLINGASGSLGSAAVQIAKFYGAEVTGVCSTKNIGLVKSLGADHVVDYTKEDIAQGSEQYDVIYDTVGKLSFQSCKKLLITEGQYISPVLKFPLLLQMLWTSLFSSRKAKFAATGLKKDHELKDMLQKVLQVIQAGKLTMVMDRQFPLEKVADAHRYIATGHKKGNIAIIV